MKELIETIINEVKEYEGMPADKITHGLKIYNGKEYNSMIAGITARISDMQKILDVREEKIEKLEKILTVGGILSVTGISTMLVIIHFLKREQEKLKDAIEMFKKLECKDVDGIECSECGKKAHNVDEISVLFGYKKIEGNLIPEAVCKECRRGL